ncbi:hypothetical protein [Streptomyces sp. NPDC002346]
MPFTPSVTLNAVVNAMYEVLAELHATGDTAAFDAARPGTLRPGGA